MKLKLTISNHIHCCFLHQGHGCCDPIHILVVDACGVAIDVAIDVVHWLMSPLDRGNEADIRGGEEEGGRWRRGGGGRS